ncbi:MAG: flagellar biosynthetic protein FliR [Planctomycetaceae bacterium]
MIETAVLAVTLILMRVASFVAFARPWGDRVVPTTVKIGLAVALTGLWTSTHLGPASIAAALVVTSPSPWLLLGWLAGREVLIGIAFAWFVNLFFAALRTAGAYVAQEMGLTLGALTSPLDQQPSSVITQLFETIGTLLFLIVGGHHAVLRLLGLTLDLAPVGAPVELPRPGWVLSVLRSAEQTGLELAAPIGVGLFLVTVVMAVAMRLVPQFNLMSFGTPLRLLAGLGLLALLMPDIVNRMLVELSIWTR